MESAYSLANAQLAGIRENNKNELRKREDEVRGAAPEFAEIEARLAQGGLALSKCVLSGSADISAIRDFIERTQADKKRILKKLNLPDNYLDEIYSCEKCRDTGFDDSGRRCECLKNMVSKYIGVNSNLTEVMRNDTFENFDFTLYTDQGDIKGIPMLKVAQKIYGVAKDFADNFDVTGENLYLYGSAGTGKTYLTSCIANRVLGRGKSVYYQSAFQILDMMEKLKFGRLEDDEISSAEYASKYAYSVDLLIIDDVGTEFVSAYSSAALFDIINSRLMSGKSTVISSNLSPERIGDIYGARMESRIIGSFKPMYITGKDLRRKNFGKGMLKNSPDHIK